MTAMETDGLFYDRELATQDRCTYVGMLFCSLFSHKCV